MPLHLTSRSRRLAALIVAVHLIGPGGLLTAPGVLAIRPPLPAVAWEATPAANPVVHPESVTVATPFRLVLSTRDDFVAQTTFVQCVGASMQMMLNIIGPEDDRSAATQAQLQSLARSLSGPRPDGTERKGASVNGWSAGLNELGAGPYRVAGDPDLQAVLRTAASAILKTGRPVGLLVWSGRHAWVMSGFTATADPRLTNDFTLTGITVMDPLYPYGSTAWGPSPKPGQTLSLAELGRQFVPRRTDWSSNVWLRGFGGQYVIVMPWAPTIARWNLDRIPI